QTFGDFIWNVGTLAAGTSATISLQYFNLSAGAVPVFGQVSNLAEADVDSSPDNNNTLTPTEDDEAVVIINEGAATNRMQMNSETALSKYRKVQLLRVFPSLTAQDVNIMLESIAAEPATLRIFDSSGREVATEQRDMLQGINEWRLNVSRYQSGMYHILIQPEAGLPATGRFVKQNP
ncbi:MAG: T9SS type A sorting domain-containing protein, partial [Bacteroidota bacterium]